ncbi:MAG: hypothetical protein U5M50_16210 [Sphingobium sp.]|nr:hypothetical protein [Sphingobium sp.]
MPTRGWGCTIASGARSRRNSVQTQTIKNKKAMEASAKDGPSAQEQHMEKLAENRELRREYMMNQAMIRSLEREQHIQ